MNIQQKKKYKETYQIKSRQAQQYNNEALKVIKNNLDDECNTKYLMFKLY